MLGETLDATAASLRELLPAEDLPRTVPVPSPVPGAGSTTGPAAQGSTATSAGGEGVGPATSDTREQIAAGLERMCRSLEAREPSSPVPLVLRGAKQMLTMSFLELSRHSDLFEKLAALDGGTRKGEES
jgi:type VI secretion system protein ImpA